MRPTPLAVLAAAALLIAGCGDTGAEAPESEAAISEPAETPTEESTAAAGASDEQSLQRIADAVDATVEAGTVRFEMTVETAGTQGDDGVQPVTIEGEEDFDAQQRSLTFAAPGGQLLAIMEASDVYVQLPATEDDNWARIELDALLEDAPGFGGPGGLPFQSTQANLEVLRDTVTAAVEGGTEDVDGVSATRYDLTVDLVSAASEATDDANDTFAAYVAASGVQTLAMQVWIDDEDHISRVAYTVDLSQADVEAATEAVASEVASELAPAGQVTVTVDYFDFGTALAIEIPDESQVVDLDEEEIRGSMTGAGATAPDDTTSTEAPSEAATDDL